MEVVAQYFQRTRLWGLKDPVALRYYHLTDEEFWLLERLDGRSSLAEIEADFGQRFTPRKLERPMLQSFLTQLHHEGLITVDAAGQGDVLLARRVKVRRDLRLAAWMRPFIIRFRGVDPEPLLRWAYPAVRRLFSWPALLAAGALVIFALITVAAQSQRLAAELATLTDFFQPRNLLWIALVIGGTRAVHELAHAFTCRRFGGECHELGFMLFLLAPAVYCDVTSAWMMRSKWARMAVSAAGIVAELVLASIAALLWRFSEPGLLHDLALVVMTLCTVNTLLLNGNPLLRYDGYHVLADWLETPNLARRADDVWRRWALRLWYGEAAVDETIDPSESLPSPAAAAGLALYALASKVYLLLVVVAALLLFDDWAKQNQMQFLGAAMTAAVVVGMAATPTLRAVRGWSSPRSVNRPRGGRFWIVTLGAIVAAIILLLVPLPRSITTTGTLRPASVESVYVTQSGFLQSIVSGRRVKEGEAVAVLADPELSREVLRLESERDRAALALQNLERRQAVAAAGSLDLPTARQALADAEERLARRRDDERRLKLRASRAGHVIAAPRRPPGDDDPRSLRSWSGSLADDENRGAFLESGTPVCQIGEPNRVEAEAVVGQADVLYVRPGAEATLLTDVGLSRRLTGRVVEVGQAAVDDRSSPASPKREPTAASEPIEYQVRIEIAEPPADATFDAPLRVKIDAPRESLGAKCVRLFSQTFRLR